MLTATEKMCAVLDSTATSYWLEYALRTSIKRDPLDALHDAELLVEILRQRADELLGKPR